MLFVALSCLQGRPMDRAFAELAALGAGIQLTPGNLPTAGFAAQVAGSAVATGSPRSTCRPTPAATMRISR